MLDRKPFQKRFDRKLPVNGMIRRKHFVKSMMENFQQRTGLYN
jgi:hypothetical protein